MWCVSLSRIYGAVNWHIGTLPDWHIISLFHSVSKQYPYPAYVKDIFFMQRVLSLIAKLAYFLHAHDLARSYA